MGTRGGGRRFTKSYVAKIKADIEADYQAADTVLSSSIDTVDAAVDAILSGSSESLNQFIEVVEAFEAADVVIRSELAATSSALLNNITNETGSTARFSLNVLGVTELSGGLVHKRFPRTNNYTVTTTDYFLAANSSGGAITFTLPNAASASEGQTWVFKDEGGVANTNNIFISAAVGQTIDGSSQIALESPYASVQIYTDGVSKYYIF
tara:strand:+ start:301 stop:927 length:627 start_codon:yes stop_codon:yes gene_type:complete